MFNSLHKKYLGLLNSLLIVILANPVSADDTNFGQQFEEIRKELKTLRGEVRRIQSTLDALTRLETAPQRVRGSKVSLDLKRTLGSRDAMVGIVEFSDYQCPYCRRFHTEVFAALRHKYIDSGKVLYSYRDFPLSFHPEAKPAAIATNCAGEQGRESRGSNQ